MCEICEKFGDPRFGDSLWYLNPYNYSKNLYRLRAPGEGLSGAKGHGEAVQHALRPAGAAEPPPAPRGGGLSYIPQLQAAIEKGDIAEFVRVQQETNVRMGTVMQICPLDDSDKVLELAAPVILMRCECRSWTRGRDERCEEDYTCCGLGPGQLKWERWPEDKKGGVKFVNAEEAKEWNHKMDKLGYCHILMNYGAPYIGGFCQCDYPDCGAVRAAVDFGTEPLKSHYVAELDYNRCNGCGICAQRCMFGALKIEITPPEKANIDQFKCYGCGLCETGCSRGAIKLVRRETIPDLAEVWR